MRGAGFQPADVHFTRCPNMGELPLPPPGKTDWPWTEESPQLPDTMPDPPGFQSVSRQAGFIRIVKVQHPIKRSRNK